MHNITSRYPITYLQVSIQYQRNNKTVENKDYFFRENSIKSFKNEKQIIIHLPPRVLLEALLILRYWLINADAARGTGIVPTRSLYSPPKKITRARTPLGHCVESTVESSVLDCSISTNIRMYFIGCWCCVTLKIAQKLMMILACCWKYNDTLLLLMFQLSARKNARLN